MPAEQAKPEPAAIDSKEPTRAELARAYRGKFAHVPGTSEEFAAAEQEEIEREDRVR